MLRRPMSSFFLERGRCNYASGAQSSFSQAPISATSRSHSLHDFASGRTCNFNLVARCAKAQKSCKIEDMESQSLAFKR